MSTVSLNTFSAIMTFAIDLEDALGRFYASAAPLAGAHAEHFQTYAAKSIKRKQRLTAIRQDNVTEMVLEPISGLDVDNYKITASTPADAAEALSTARTLEQRASRFYTDAEAKLNVTEPRRAFQKMAQENEDRLAVLS